jgi:3-oxoacyl-[acyl-carrier-protein] synthase-3
MQYRNVFLEAVAYSLPDEVVTTAELESRLSPLYRRLKLPEGRLELMTGIQERRFFPQGTRPSEVSAITGQKAIDAAGVSASQIGALVHGSVCRDVLEPATACMVHGRLGLPEDCLVFDVSNACLGLLTGAIQLANMIELGQIECGLVVGTEDGRTLVENTVRYLNETTSLTRNDIKPAIASLTIGSGSAAILLANERLSRGRHRLVGGVVHANTRQCDLCQGGHEQATGSAGNLLMETDSEALLREGVATAKAAWPKFLEAVGWKSTDLDRIFCHQVGKAHRKLLLDELCLSPEIDFGTFEFLGNTGSAALPITAAMGIERGLVKPGDCVAWLGIGSGINVVMLGVEWGRE